MAPVDRSSCHDDEQAKWNKEDKKRAKKELRKQRKRQQQQEKQPEQQPAAPLAPASHHRNIREKESSSIGPAPATSSGTGQQPCTRNDSPIRRDKKKKKKEHKKRRKQKHADDNSHDHDVNSTKEKRQRTEETGVISDGRGVSSSESNDANNKNGTAETSMSVSAIMDDMARKDPRIVESSALDYAPPQHANTTTTNSANITSNSKNGKNQSEDDNGKNVQENGVTLLLFYQYVEPDWPNDIYKLKLVEMEELGTSLGLTGRMRVAREGLNCTLTATRTQILQFCHALRQKPEFQTTEFKLTNDLPPAQRFPPPLKVIPVIELVHYGLEGEKKPPIQDYHGVHLEPKEYHRKIAEENTVMIDVRNHYEAIIGRFQPPTRDDAWLDPKMRKSTEFPVWLDKPETKEQLKGKQVLMYCTGGIRCERATALLRYRMEHDPEIKDLGIQGVYQLQGGIDKYFKEFPDGGYWVGKNYVFDKRCAHAPPAVEGQQQAKTTDTVTAAAVPEQQSQIEQPMSRCEACQKPWDRFRGKRRCPTCGVPSLICKDCHLADQHGVRKLGKAVRCDLCVEEGVTSKHELRRKEQQEITEYEAKLKRKGLLPQQQLASRKRGGSWTEASVPKGKSPKHEQPSKTDPSQANGTRPTTRLSLKNMCRQRMDEATLMTFLPGITHIVWKIDRKSNSFFGQGWVEMATLEDAANAVAKSGQRVLDRPIYITYQSADPKDAWPPPGSAVRT